MPDPNLGSYQGRERPGDSLIAVSDSDGATIIDIPARPLTLPMRLVLFANCAAVLFAVLVGVVYFLFHYSLFAGLPDPEVIARNHSPQSTRWLIEVLLGWLVALAFAVAILGLVWIPQVSREQIVVERSGLRWRRDGWWRHERLSLPWANVAEFALTGIRLDVAPNRLSIILASGKEQMVAESTSNAEREWLRSVLQESSRRYKI